MRAVEDERILVASQRWIEAAVEERVQKVLASTKSLSDWVATTCQQGAEASRITAAALHESEEARRFLEADVRRLAEQHERLEAEVVKLKDVQANLVDQQERLGTLELRIRSKEVSDTSRDDEFSSIVRDVQSLQLAMQRLESQWEKANVKFNKVGLEVASSSSAASIWEGQCRSAQALLESRLEALSKSLEALELGRSEGLDKLRERRIERDSEALAAESTERLFAAVEKRCNDLAEQVLLLSKSQVDLQDFATSLSAVDTRCSTLEERLEERVEQRRSVENLQRRMQSMQVAMETIAELRHEDHALLEELKLEHERFRQRLGDKMNSLELLQLGLQESLRLVEKVDDIDALVQRLQEDVLKQNRHLDVVKGLTKEAAREVREEIQDEFRNWVKSWTGGFQHEMPNIEKELKSQISGYLNQRSTRGSR